MDTNEFVNAYIQRMLALNNDLTNKNVMLETRHMLLEKKYNELAQAYNMLVEKYEPTAPEGPDLVVPGSETEPLANQLNKKTSSKISSEEQF